MFEFFTKSKEDIKEKSVKEPEPPTFFQVKESEFCIDKNRLEQDVKAEDIDLMKLWDNLFGLNDNTCNAECMYSRVQDIEFSSFKLFSSNDGGSYDGPWSEISISLNDCVLLCQKHWYSTKLENGKYGGKSEYIEYYFEEFYPHIKFLYDYVENALAEYKTLQYNTRRNSLLEIVNKLECKNE